MYMFPIKPLMEPEMTHFPKNAGVYSNILLQLF